MAHMCILSENGEGKTTGAISAMINQIGDNNNLQSFFCANSDASYQAVEMIRDRSNEAGKTCTCEMVAASEFPTSGIFNVIVGTPNDVINFIEDRN